MVTLTALWLPIVVSAAVVFVASSVLHMLLPYHRSDYARLPKEDDVLTALRAAGVGRGAYMFPFSSEMKELGTAEMRARFERGPVGMLTVLPNGMPMMAKHLAMWFAYSLVVGVFAAYLSGRTLAPGTAYLQVLRVAGCTAFLAYAGAQLADPIWRGASWSTTLKNVVDGLVYGLATGAVFAWLWPAA